MAAMKRFKHYTLSILRSIISLLLVVSVLSAQHQVGNTVEDFSAPFCFADTGDFNLSDYYPDEGEGQYYVLWFNLFTSW